MKTPDIKIKSYVPKIAVFFLSFLFASSLAGGALAEDPLAPLRAFWSNKLPDTTHLKNEYTNLSTKPFGREDLAFSLLIPSNWRDEKVTVKTEQLENDSQNWILLTTQLSPEEEKSEAAIQVAYIRLDLEMGLSDYMDQHVEANNYTVLLRRQGVYNEREVEEVLVRINDQIARITFSRQPHFRSDLFLPGIRIPAPRHELCGGGHLLRSEERTRSSVSDRHGDLLLGKGS